MSEANKKVLKSVWRFLKYVMIPPTLVWFVYNQLYFEFFAENYYLLFVIGAAICNACMDAVAHHYYVSIFNQKWLTPDFFNPAISWQLAKKIGGYKLDFWHLCKSAMIILLALAIVNYNLYTWWIDFIFIGYFWNISFSLFYDIILKKST